MATLNLGSVSVAIPLATSVLVPTPGTMPSPHIIYPPSGSTAVDFATALVDPADPVPAVGSNLNRSEWFAYTETDARDVTFHASGFSSPVIIEVYSGTPPPGASADDLDFMANSSTGVRDLGSVTIALPLGTAASLS